MVDWVEFFVVCGFLVWCIVLFLFGELQFFGGVVYYVLVEYVVMVDQVFLWFVLVVGDLVDYEVVVVGVQCVCFVVVEEWVLFLCGCLVFLQVFQWVVVLVLVDCVGEGLVVVGGFVEVDYYYGVVLVCVGLWVLVVVLVVVEVVLWVVVDQECYWVGFVFLVVVWFDYVIVYGFVVLVFELELFVVVKSYVGQYLVGVWGDFVFVGIIEGGYYDLVVVFEVVVGVGQGCIVMGW